MRKLGKTHTHTEQCREGGKKTNSRRPKLAWSAAWAADSRGRAPRCRRLPAWRLRDPAQLCPLPPRPRCCRDMGRSGRLGPGCRGAYSTWGARTKSGTMRGETEAWEGASQTGV